MDSGFRTYLRVDLGIVKHGNELLEEGLLGHLLVEGGVCAVHENVEQTQGEKDNAVVLDLKSTQQLV